MADADYLLARGLFCTLDGGSPAPLHFGHDDSCDDVLAAAAARRLPLLVANPDLVRPDGKASPMPGRLMARYAEKYEGAAYPVGKPYEHIYAEAIRRGCDGAAGRVLAVGDSMAHDVPRPRGERVLAGRRGATGPRRRRRGEPSRGAVARRSRARTARAWTRRSSAGASMRTM